MLKQLLTNWTFSKNQLPWDGWGNRSLFLGGSGCGKTFLACAWALWALRQGRSVIICGLSDFGMWRALSRIAARSGSFCAHYDGPYGQLWTTRAHPGLRMPEQKTVLSIIGAPNWIHSSSHAAFAQQGLEMILANPDKLWMAIYLDCSDQRIAEREELSQQILAHLGRCVWCASTVKQDEGLLREIHQSCRLTPTAWGAAFPLMPADLDSVSALSALQGARELMRSMKPEQFIRVPDLFSRFPAFPQIERIPTALVPYMQALAQARGSNEEGSADPIEGWPLLCDYEHVLLEEASRSIPKEKKGTESNRI